MKRAGGVIVTVILLVVLAGATGWLYLYVSNGQKMFTVNYGSTAYSGKSEVVIYENEFAIFYPSHLLGKNKYTLTTAPNADIDDFDYIIEEEFASFQSTDMNHALVIVQFPDSFGIYIPRGMTAILARATDKSVTSCEEGPQLSTLNLSQTPYFSVSVTSEDGAETVTLNLKTAVRGAA